MRVVKKSIFLYIPVNPILYQHGSLVTVKKCEYANTNNALKAL
nr:MAG TPA: hypothetical protein [Caudoviricetes sp.]